MKNYLSAVIIFLMCHQTLSSCLFEASQGVCCDRGINCWLRQELKESQYSFVHSASPNSQSSSFWLKSLLGIPRLSSKNRWSLKYFVLFFHCFIFSERSISSKFQIEAKECKSEPESETGKIFPI